MNTVDIAEAQTSLSELVAKLECDELDEVVITRNGHPVAKLVSAVAKSRKRVGVAEGLCEVPDDIDGHNDEITRLFNEQ